MGDKFLNNWNQLAYDAIIGLVDEKEKKGNGLIVLKDIIELRPCCKIFIVNLRQYDFIEVYKHPEDYAVTDMNTDGDYLLLLIKHVEYV